MRCGHGEKRVQEISGQDFGLVLGLPARASFFSQFQGVTPPPPFAANAAQTDDDGFFLHGIDRRADAARFNCACGE
jgi:hypothetical protein